MKIPIVVVAYNRSEALKRLLKSISTAEYNRTDIELIISIDKGGDEKVFEVATNFKWEFGKKSVIKQEINLGLKKHVLKCGDLTELNDAIIMLEDDLVVSKAFYKYAEESVNYYMHDVNIGGISLYNYKISEFANHRTFLPNIDESDVFFMNVPSSWGQIWTKNQWMMFKDWYKKTEFEKENYRGLIPESALSWGDSSWKKLFYIYIAENKKYIVYPRSGLSTNMGDIGTHAKTVTTDYQSVLMNEFNRPYFFKSLSSSLAVYDAFFENEKIVEELKIIEDIKVDYYGIKKYINKRYVLSTEILNYKLIKSWGLFLKPYELNIIYDIQGEGIFLYDTSVKEKNTLNKFNNNTRLINYELPGLTRKKAFITVLKEYRDAFNRKLRKSYKMVFRKV